MGRQTMEDIYTVLNIKELGVETFTTKQDVADYLKVHRNTIRFEDGMYFSGFYCVIEGQLTRSRKLKREKI
jgi:hypothetical protein